MSTKNLERLLMQDAEFLEKIKDLKFAHAVYDAFCNREWMNAEGDRWACSFRYAAGLVANARDVGETYIDFYLRDMIDPYFETDENGFATFIGILERLGWREVTVDDEMLDGQKILDLLELAEKRPKQTAPGWKQYYDFAAYAVDAGSLLGRIEIAADEGRISEEEYLWMRGRCFLTPEAEEKLGVKAR